MAGKRNIYLTESQVKYIRHTLNEMSSKYLVKAMQLATCVPTNDLSKFEEMFSSYDDEERRGIYDYLTFPKKRINDQFIEIMQKYL